MIRSVLAVAFTLGASAILWMAATFVATDALALTITLVIAAVYLLGFIELLQFRRASLSLTEALAPLSAAVDELQPWLARLHPSLQNAVRRRIEGETAGLPAPVLTPYLVGLLVMLGLLGTFVGMVDTLQGAVLALEGTDELQAIRAGLAAPIQGLGLAFGTSVAGVTGSAMLGLISTLCRRERMLATRQLDQKIAGPLCQFSLSYQRRQGYEALQSQAKSLPQVAEQLANTATKLDQVGDSLTSNQAQFQQSMVQMADKLSHDLTSNQSQFQQSMQQMSDQLSHNLTGNQAQFHQAMQERYDKLASSVDKSLQESVSQTGRLTAETVQPIITAAMDEISAKLSQQTESCHQQLSSTASTQLQEMTDSFQRQADSWLEQQGSADRQRLESFSQFLQQSQQQASEQLLNNASGVIDELQQFSQKQQSRSSNLLSEVTRLLTASDALIEARTQSESTWLATQTAADEQRLAAFSEFLQQAQQQANQQLAGTASQFTDQLQEFSRMQQGRATSLLAEISQLLAASDALLETRTQAESAWQAQQATADKQRLAAFTEYLQQSQQQSNAQLSDTTQQVIDELQQFSQQQQGRSTSLLSEMSRLLSSSEALIEARAESENKWLDSHQQRMDSISAGLDQQLTALGSAEQARSDAAIERLGKLESTVSEHLLRLGQELEAPMSRLIETASETPRAAADVIAKLRQEISNNMERDNQLLEERQQLMQQLNQLSGSLTQSTDKQGRMLEQLVSSSASTLEQLGSQFSQQVDAEAGKLSSMVEQFSGSAVEMASLGDSFGVAVQQFNDANSQMINSLGRIETSLQTSNNRSDEQLGYYVAQARDIIDHSILSQKQMLEELRQRSQPQALTEAID